MHGSILLSIYRAASAAAAPLCPLFLRLRQRRGKEDAARLGERLGRPGRPRPTGRLAWLHGASIGEALALLPLVEKLEARGFNVLVTTGTQSSAAVLARRLPAGAMHQFLPVDVPRFMAHFVQHWRPDLALIAESEIWPNLFVAIRRQAVPLVLVNARLSARSFARWQKLPHFIGALLGGTTLCLAQTEADGLRFSGLGAPQVVVAGNLKYDVAPPPIDSQRLADLVGRIAGRPIWVAASTHPGEDEIVIAAHRQLQSRIRGLITVIVPRHVGRGAEIARLAARRGLDVELRSADARGPLPALYIADTMGETGLFYRLASVVFLGKSLRVGGGQNPIEPAKLGCAILHGPAIGNFVEIFAALDAAEGALEVQNAETLADMVAWLLGDAAALRQTARNAAATVERFGGASEAIMRSLQPLLDAVALA